MLKQRSYALWLELNLGKDIHKYNHTRRANRSTVNSFLSEFLDDQNSRMICMWAFVIAQMQGDRDR